MNDKPAQQPPIAKSSLIPLIENIHVPFLYFDSAPNFGVNDGICNVTLESVRRFTNDGNSIATDRITVAHLRMSLAAAHSLKVAVEGLLLTAAPAKSGAKN